jgi:hypothetical protein
MPELCFGRCDGHHEMVDSAQARAYAEDRRRSARSGRSRKGDAFVMVAVSLWRAMI